MTFEQRLADYAATMSWVAHQLRAVGPAQLDLPTPCADFSVRALMGHLLGTALRGLGTARGESTRHVPHVITDVPDAELAARYAATATQLRQAWRGIAGPEQLVVAPWGECTARQAVEGFTVETLVHGWDLATATGRPREELAEVAERCLHFAAAAIPDRLRGVMYDDPVAATGADGATTRLARQLGRR